MNILFVYNKKAGKKFKSSLVNDISVLLPQSVDYSFCDINEFSKIDISNYDVLTAIGGDGTVNTVARIAKEQGKKLAIIPKGSGDGLARFLKIPRHLNKAIDILLHGKKIKIDTASIANHFFINVAGTGFEAEVAHKFGKDGVRGLLGYANTILQCFKNRDESIARITTNGATREIPFFSLSVANGSQWGNNFEIASAADIQDGLLEIAIMRKPSLFQIVSLIRYLKNKKQEDNQLFSYYSGSNISIESEPIWHIDGEPIELNKNITVKVDQQSLTVIAPK